MTVRYAYIHTCAAVGLELKVRTGEYRIADADELYQNLVQAKTENDSRMLRIVRRAAKDAVIYWEGEYALLHAGDMPSAEDRKTKRKYFEIIHHVQEIAVARRSSILSIDTDFM